MKQKLFTLFLALITGAIAFAHDAEIGYIYYLLDSDTKTATVTYGGSSYFSYSNAYFGSVVIPASVTYNGTTYSVTSIREKTFYKCSKLTSVTIPNSVTSIGVGAFEGCSSLTSINVDPNNPNYISVDGVLFNKDKTTLVVYPGGKQGAYTIPEGIEQIADSAFFDCSSLTSITIPNSVTSIGNFAFTGCTSLTSATIPDSVTSIGNFAFHYCTSLTSVAIPNSVTSIGDWSFQYCTSLTSVTIPNSVTTIGDDAFGRCSSLISITIPNSVTSIGEYAFYECSSLTSVTIGNGVTSIGNFAFYNCSSLTSITIHNSVTRIGSSAFYDCNKLVDVYCYATTPPEINENSFSNYNAFLYVPCKSKKAYMVDAVWGNFKYIECISSEGIEDVQSDEAQSTKVVKDGQVLILRNGKTYTMQGQEVR